MSKRDVKILAFVGMAGAGKSSAVDFITANGHPKIYAGGVVYDEMRAQNIEITPESQKIFREEMRTMHGPDYFIRKCAEQMHRLINAGQKYIVLDGLYTWSEYKFLKKEFPGELTVIAIVAPRKLRHRRLAQRPERPFTKKEAIERDWSEIENLEKGGPIAIADDYIINDGNLDDLHAKLSGVINDVHFCKAPMQC